MNTLAARRVHQPVDTDLCEVYGAVIRGVHRDLVGAFAACMRDWQARRPDAVRLEGAGGMACAFIRLQPGYRAGLRACPKAMGWAAHESEHWIDSADDEAVMFVLERRGLLASGGEPHVTVVAYASDLGASMVGQPIGRIA